MKSLFLKIVLIFAVLGSLGANKSDNNTFVATKEWQEIKEGQKIPPGLHVRINLTTLKKEAKLLENNDSEESNKSENHALSALPEEAISTSSPSDAKSPTKSKTKHLLSDALKRAPRDALAVEHSPQAFQKIKKDYKMIKETYDEMRKHFKTDAEIITKIVQNVVNVTTQDSYVMEPEHKIKWKMDALNNLYHMVDQIDNGVLFVQIGGLEKVLLPIIVNETDTTLRVQALRVLGTLTQNNPKTKIAAFENNVGEHLSRILMTSNDADELSAGVFAFGTFIRRFPIAQERILSTSGSQALIDVLKKECELKIKAKVVTIISDLVVERRLLTELSTENYTESKLFGWLSANSFCETIETLIPSNILELLEQSDIMEDFVEVMENTYTLCNPQWPRNSRLFHTLTTLYTSYLRTQDEHKLEISERLKSLIPKVFDNGIMRDEL
ncbi:nucleotide exchange factor Sil1 [Teleopsis dalmanni]|uniref:nucleotide exchange factor Sil1 n=1 Tax=Teleopsis dalmanni TaxID=139649 RepID=UPI0018CE31AD|nr:nucleotide exchange factor Sil1 [Teleopsis dalmanni]